jgi:excisionase family DNA binding protein
MNEIPFPKPESLWTVSDLARFLKISPNAAYKLVERHQVPHIRLRRKVLFDPQTIRNWIGQHMVKAG